MGSIDAALLILRAWLGVVMLAHGVNHVRSLDGTASWFAGKGFRRPRLVAAGSAYGEIAIGLGLTIGLLTAPAAAGLIATMTAAFWTIHRKAGFFVFHRPDEGWEYVATLSIGALAIAIIGPGSVSVDAALGLDGALSGWTGFGIALAGVLLGIIGLTGFWRRPG